MDKPSNNMMIYKVSWLPEDHIKDLADLLGDASVEIILSTLVDYVSSNIEPIGWTALWVSTGMPDFDLPNSLKSISFIVDVLDISQEKLEASVAIKCLMDSYDDNSSEFQTWFNNIKLKEVNVPLTELYVFANQENTSLDMTLTAEVIEQVRFIYENIWQPWDTYEEILTYNINLIKERMTVYQNISSGVISKDIAVHMKKLLREAREIHKQIIDIESRTEMYNAIDIDQNDIVRLMKLNKEMEQYKSKYEILKDPSLRELAIYQEQLERGDFLKSQVKEGVADVLLVTNLVEVEQFLQVISSLKSLLESLPNVYATSKLQGFPTLQIALDAAKVGSTIILLPGIHVLKHLGALSKGGSICGLGDGVTIRGSHETGDILFDVIPKYESSLLLESVNIEPLNNQVAVCIHEGKVSMKNCNFQGGTTGISILGSSKCEISNCLIKDQSQFGIDNRSSSRCRLQNVTVENCNEAAIRAEDGSYVYLVQHVVIKNCNSGILIASNDCLKSVANNEIDHAQRNNTVSKILNGKENLNFFSNKVNFSYSCAEI